MFAEDWVTLLQLLRNREKNGTRGKKRKDIDENFLKNQRKKYEEDGRESRENKKDQKE